MARLKSFSQQVAERHKIKPRVGLQYTKLDGFETRQPSQSLNCFFGFIDPFYGVVERQSNGVWESVDDNRELPDRYIFELHWQPAADIIPLATNETALVETVVHQMP